MIPNLTWNTNGRLPGSLDYYDRRNLTTTQDCKKFDNARYLIMIAFDSWPDIKSESDFLMVFGPLENTLDYILKRLLFESDSLYADECRVEYDKEHTLNWDAELLYISDRWMSIHRIDWLLFMIQYFKKKQQQTDAYQKALQYSYNIDKFKEVI